MSNVGGEEDIEFELSVSEPEDIRKSSATQKTNDSATQKHRKMRSDGNEPPLSREDMNRVHEELEKLNIATEVINQLEVQLDEARKTFRDIQSSWGNRLEQLSRKLGSCIDKSRPYYEARLEVHCVHERAHAACIRFERANSMHQVAKQQVALTQDSLNRNTGKGIDAACLEVLNHHIQRVNDAEAERVAAEEQHRLVSQDVHEINVRVSKLEKEFSRPIKKSRTYFEARVEFTRVLEQQKALIQRLDTEIRQKKLDYNQALRNLEQISERIHEQRQTGDRSALTTARSRDDSAVSVSGSVESTIPDDPPSQLSPAACALLQRASVERRESSSIPLGVAEGEDGGETVSTLTVSEFMQRPQRLFETGVILLPTDLTGLFTPQTAQTTADAFKLPPEQLDFSYNTAPEGVKRHPTPPNSAKLTQSSSASSSAPSTPHSLDGAEIDSCAEQAKNLLITNTRTEAAFTQTNLPQSDSNHDEKDNQVN